jgi:hypothetical protein
MVLGGLTTYRLIESLFRKSFSKQWIELQSVISLDVVVAAGGLPPLIYDLVVTQSDPYLQIWNIQNLTETPSLFSTILALSPLMIFALIECVHYFRKSQKSLSDKLLVVWFILGLIMLYLPLSLQRRFMMGIFIPTAVLGIKAFLRIIPNKRLIWQTLLWLLILPTNLIILMSSFFGISTRDDQVYISREEYRMMEEIKSIPDYEVILAGPESGLFIPAYSGKRVVYGHPYESIFAEEREQLVKGFYSGKFSLEEEMEIIDSLKVDLIYYGPREKELGTPNILESSLLIEQTAGVTLYLPQDN